MEVRQPSKETAFAQGGKTRSAFAGLDVYLDRRVISVLFLGFSSGLPLMLLVRTLSAWLADSGVDKATIGLFGFVLAPYTFKFLWAPFIDRLRLPVLTKLFGRRRSWLLLTQLCLMMSIFALGQTDPVIDPILTAQMACLVAFCSASQDIVIDAYRIEILHEEQYGAGSANVVTGYRLGMWVAGAGALFIADAQGWSVAYSAIALLVLVGVLTVLFNPEPTPLPDDETHKEMPIDLADRRQLAFLMLLAIALGTFTGLLIGSTFGQRHGWLGGVLMTAVLAGLFALLGPSKAFRQAVIDPFRDFLERHGLSVALAILAFISLYRASDVLLTLMANPFYLETGFTKSEIAWVSGTFGFVMTFVGSYLAGLMIYRIGILKSLWISGILVMASNAMFALQAYAGDHYVLFHITILVENASGGMGTTAFVAYLAALCNQRYTAVQYAMLTSFMQMLGKYVIVPGSGILVEGLQASQGNVEGWITFFILSAFAGLPALVVLWWLGRRMPSIEKTVVR